jgi:hypothetical protein
LIYQSLLRKCRDATNSPVLAWRSNSLSASRTAESARQKDDKAYQQNQAEPTAADDGATKVKSATAEQEKQNYDE